MSVLSKLRAKNLHTWMRGYARNLARRTFDRPLEDVGTRHVMFAICDHYEPLWGKGSMEGGRARVKAWRDGYPRSVAGYRDADGRPPRHSFFYAMDEYHPEFLEGLAPLIRGGFGEVELHLHHDGDTAATLRPALERYVADLVGHGHLSRPGGQPRYAFIHGNWALANARPDRRWCGVDDELVVLHETGCYADFTFPSAPDPCQPDVVNEIYWPTGDLSRRRAQDGAELAAVGRAHDDRMLIITGPLGFARKGRTGLRLENGALTGADPPSAERVRTWVAQEIQVRGRPEWLFVKVHTHGAPEETARSLLGAGATALHDALATFNDGRRFALHYVTAREMYNVARAAMDGKSGDPAAYLDYKLPPPPAAR